MGFGAFVDAVDEGADFVEADAEDIEAMAEEIVGAINLCAEAGEILIQLFGELGELFAGKELGFEGCFADELLAERSDGESGSGGDEPVGEVGGIGGGQLGENG